MAAPVAPHRRLIRSIVETRLGHQDGAGREGGAEAGGRGAEEDPTRRLDELMPARQRPDRNPGVAVFPAQLHVGDRFTDAAGDEWEIASRPVTYKQGHEVRARIQRPGNPATAKEEFWPAYERLTIRRNESEMADRRRALLLAALAAVRVKEWQTVPELAMFHARLDTGGLGAIVVGMRRHGYDLSLTSDENGWRATFLHRSYLMRPWVGQVLWWWPTPWRAVQEARVARG